MRPDNLILCWPTYSPTILASLPECDRLGATYSQPFMDALNAFAHALSSSASLPTVCGAGRAPSGSALTTLMQLVHCQVQLHLLLAHISSLRFNTPDRCSEMSADLTHLHILFTGWINLL